MYVTFVTLHTEQQYLHNSSLATIRSPTFSVRNNKKNQNNNNNNNNNYTNSIKSDKNNHLESEFVNNQKSEIKDSVNSMIVNHNIESIARRTEEKDNISDEYSSNVTNSTSSVTATSYRIISHAKVVTLETLLLSSNKQQLITRKAIRNNSTVEDVTTKENHNAEWNGSNVIWVAGIVLDPANITKDVFQSLVQLNCNTTVGDNLNVHILTSSSASSTNIRAAYQQYYTYQKKFNTNETCGKFILATEPSSPITNITASTVQQNKNRRVDVIAAARDYQRTELRNYFYNTTKNSSTAMSNNFVILIDLDLFSIPNVHEIMKQINEMTRSSNVTTYSTDHNNNNQSSSYYDIICAAGIMYQPYGYYDTFATILLPNTFVYPVSGRLSRSINPDEDATMIRSDDLYGTVTQFDLLDYFENFSRSGTTAVQLIPGNFDPLQHAKEEEDTYYNQFVRPVPVRSCFGGFAIYRASTYFNPRCDYSAPYQQQQDHSKKEGQETMTQNEKEEELILMMKRHSSRRSERPCEHVMFHDCLHRTSAEHQQQLTRVAVHPRLRTEWNNRTNIFGNTLWEGATRHNGLNTYFNQRTRGERLVSPNKRYTLRINEDGMLVVEDWHTTYEKSTTTSGTIIWTPPIDRSLNIFRTIRWTHMFLWLHRDGQLQLIKHAPYHSIIALNNFTESKHCEYSSPVSKNTEEITLENPCQCNIKLDSCNILLWSEKYSLPEGERTRLSLTLFDDGVLSIIGHPGETKHIVWKASINANNTI